MKVFDVYALGKASQQPLLERLSSTDETQQEELEKMKSTTTVTPFSVCFFDCLHQLSVM